MLIGYISTTKNNTMKKILLLLLIAPVLGFGQVLTDVFYVWQKYDYESVNGSEIPTYNTSSDEYFLVVPDDKLWVIESISMYSLDDTDKWFTNNTSFYISNNDTVTLYIHSNPAINAQFISPSDFHQGRKMVIAYSLGDFIPSGTKFYYFKYTNVKSIIKIREYSLDTNSLSYNEPEIIKNNSNTPVLFPNPTSSLLALNSEKEYDIEVYDMAGNKLMALSGNNINMEHLSTATYIVKATDKSNNEELTYKVVKN
jgi:hypothetical protein